MKTTRPVQARERAFLVGVALKRAARVPGVEVGQIESASLLELEELARSAGAQVVGSVLQRRDAIDPATLVGRGKLDEIKVEARMRQAPLVVFDKNLSPVQQRNIERLIECRVIDRTQLILDIFARHARSREGQLQVELAQLNYLLPRLTGKGAEMSRLGGKSGSMSGGIGMRGPGEQKLETDRRRIRERVRRVRESIEMVRRQRGLRRRARQAIPLATVAMVGYTNAGKSTLFNALTRAGVHTSAQMFATLDPTVRAVRLPSSRKVLLSDTVGFIRDLPPALLVAFRATLEEVQEAAVVLQVTDMANPRYAEQDAEVEKVLVELGVSDRPRLHVYNKTDLLPADEAQLLRNQNGNVFVSAQKGTGLQSLLERLDQVLPADPTVQLSLRLPLSDGRTLALLRARGRILSSEVSDGHMLLEAEVPESFARQFRAAPASSE